MNLIEAFHDRFKKNVRDTAFCSGDDTFSYGAFVALVNGSRVMLESRPEFKRQQPVGVLCTERIETYAAIFAIWFSGGIFVPISREVPPVVLNELIDRYGIEILFSVDEEPAGINQGKIKVIQNSGKVAKEELPLHNWKKNDRMYILTTSGSTGVPKSVPISLMNVQSFIEGFIELYPELSANDNFLQTYELTADAAFTGYIIPFMLGAAVFSVPATGFKPFNVVRILSEKPISWVQVTPSLLACLQPFFQSLYFDHIKHFHFGGEALPADLVEEWRRHVPNAEISNVYGPTETTITATIYKLLPGDMIKARNGVVSIGKPLKKVETFISKRTDVDYGELLIAGDQVMENYLFEAKQSFKVLEEKGRAYYPTGDFVDIDQEGFLYYYGRKDEQVKINGYRVDLVEIENKVRSVIAPGKNIAAAVIEKLAGLNQLVVFVEGYEGNGREIIQQLNTVLPHYKIPDKIVGVTIFPVSSSGKTDKKILVSNYKKLVKEDGK